MAFHFTSDTHFNHNNIIGYCSRPWENVLEMNEGLIQNWNSVVGQDDVVFHLGDFAMGNTKLIPEILSRLNGKVVLVRGNHDQSKSLEYFSAVVNRVVLDVDGFTFEMAHNPEHLKQKYDFALCGHVHEKWVYKKKGDLLASEDTYNSSKQDLQIATLVNIYNVGVDVRNYKPVSLKEILSV